jgi:hypothetical protein
MRRQRDDWTGWAADLAGPGFARFQTELTKYNAQRFQPRLPEEVPAGQILRSAQIASAELVFIESLRNAVGPLTSEIPSDVDGFIAWFEHLKHAGPGQGDPLFPWLADQASLEQMTWFLLQEVAGETGFDDLLAMTQIKISVQAKLEMARNFWDEMGRGAAAGMHGPMLARLADHFGVAPTAETVAPESLALGNTMIALACHRRYAFHSVGALGVIEMTAPTRAGYVNEGLRRLGVPAKKRHYFAVHAVHAVLDVKHSQAWNREVLRPLVAEDPRRAKAIGEGAVIRLWHGARTFERYRNAFGLAKQKSMAA